MFTASRGERHLGFCNSSLCQKLFRHLFFCLPNVRGLAWRMIFGLWSATDCPKAFSTNTDHILSYLCIYLFLIYFNFSVFLSIEKSLHRIFAGPEIISHQIVWILNCSNNCFVHFRFGQGKMISLFSLLCCVLQNVYLGKYDVGFSLVK